MTRLGLKIDQETKQKLKEKAQTKGLTLSGYSRMALKEKLQTHKCPYCGLSQENKEKHKEHVKRCFE